MYSKKCGIQFYKSSCNIYTVYSVYRFNRDDNRVATKMRTYFEMRTDGQRFFV